MSERYKELSDDIQEKFMEIYNQKAFPIKIGFSFVSDSKLKNVISVKKITDIYSFLLGREILVSINETLYDKMDEDLVEILFEQEIDKIEIKAQDGKISMARPDIVTFSPLIAKHGYEKVARANQVDTLSSQQQDDMDGGFK